MKRGLCLLLAVVVLSLTACGAPVQSGGSPDGGDATAQTQQSGDSAAGSSGMDQEDEIEAVPSERQAFDQAAEALLAQLREKGMSSSYRRAYGLSDAAVFETMLGMASQLFEQPQEGSDELPDPAQPIAVYRLDVQQILEATVQELEQGMEQPTDEITRDSLHQALAPMLANQLNAQNGTVTLAAGNVLTAHRVTALPGYAEEGLYLLVFEEGVGCLVHLFPWEDGISEQSAHIFQHSVLESLEPDQAGHALGEAFGLGEVSAQLYTTEE